ncbi:ArsR family transcriptional regulator [Tyzzerella sp. An114]|uniref:DeoR/GlpR family DNA-binding transcription regulator n=1 Tax=Tyzzerella sp. An114 TaxID=1965545 RepID=UPI000B438432|nr:DeoR/GlpR family DNA-binding transcription regulator [Tyzzerella sp. An114]OUQ60068.1 ArsR family transcriptional regulator [Tyzzerella sp. An114]HIT73320.1 DeoR/GlpR transcriptional regulator [Candidatus Fimicola cottocaccae]
MKRERAYVENRRNMILEAVEENHEVRVEQLAERFNVSPVTIRRDLQYLEDNKMLVRFYGGALSKLADQERQYQDEDDVQIYRELIARYAGKLVDDGDTIFINSSSTALKVLEFVDKQNVVVITNNGKAIHAKKNDGLSVILTGGELRHPKEAMVGDYAIRNLQTVYAKKAFIGCSGISPESGMTTENANEVNINKLMIEHASVEMYLVADHTKIGKNSSFISCNIEQVTNLITDEKAPADVLELLREKGVKIHLVKKSDFL